MKVSELLDILQAERKFHHKYNYVVKVVVDKVGVFDIKDIDVSIDADYNEIYITTEKTVINRNARPNVYFDGEKYYTILHEYYGDDEHDNRKAIIFKNDNTYGVVMIKDGKIIEERLLKGHSEEYAENCAENFVMGIIYRGDKRCDIKKH
tara:strand:- start:1254 stop:1703 length:450 start_codon:yes stop_codon:yes gene_type:complete